MSALPWEGWPSCPCGCGVEGLKLSKPIWIREDGVPVRQEAHVVGCKCRPHIGKRNRAAGVKSERRRHLALGGTGGTPRDELMHSYSINVTTSDKHGRQVPAEFRRFIASEWFRRALQTAEKKVPVGSDAMPAVFLEPDGGGHWLVVKVPMRGLR